MTDKRKQKGKRNSSVAGTLLIAVLCAIVFSTVVFSFITTERKADTDTSTVTAAPETTLPQGPYIESTVTIGSAGDVLMHMPVLESAR